MHARADLLDLVEGTHLEFEAAAFRLRHLGLGAHLMSRWPRCRMMHLYAGADRRLACFIVGADRIDRRHLHHADHGRGRHHARERRIELAREVVIADGDRERSLGTNRNRTHQSPPTITNPTNRWIMSASEISAPIVKAIVRHGWIAFR